MMYLRRLVNALAAVTDVVLGWIWVLVSLAAQAFGRRPRKQDQLEAERLDRIRNPSKYLGK